MPFTDIEGRCRTLLPPTLKPLFPAFLFFFVIFAFYHVTIDKHHLILHARTRSVVFVRQEMEGNARFWRNVFVRNPRSLCVLYTLSLRPSMLKKLLQSSMLAVDFRYVGKQRAWIPLKFIVAYGRPPLELKINAFAPLYRRTEPWGVQDTWLHKTWTSKRKTKKDCVVYY